MIENKNATIVINDIHYDLDGLEQLAWKQLVSGAARSKDGFHTLCVATMNTEGEPTLRTVVHRKADEIVKKIFFHTDTRSRKFQDLQRDSRLSMLFYDAHRRIQMTLKATATLHTTDALAEDRWRATNAQSRRCYMTIDAPNTTADFPTVGYDKRFAKTDPTEDESCAFRQNFAVVECQTHHLEFLFLHHTGNRKAIFKYENGVLKESFWAVP
jgi:pyridoxamine 5'-phosphate oxidase